MLLSGTGVEYLLPNQIYSGSFNANHADISSNDYLIVQVIPSSVIKCDTKDNESVSPTAVLTSRSSSASTDMSVIWHNDTKSYSTKQWNSKDLTYPVYTAAGIKMKSGVVVAGDITQLILPSHGVYMLVVSDGKRSVGKKILY